MYTQLAYSQQNQREQQVAPNEEEEEETTPSTPEKQSSLSDDELLQLDLLENFQDDFEPSDDLIDTPNRQFWHKMQQKADHAWNMHQAIESEKQALLHQESPDKQEDAKQAPQQPVGGDNQEQQHSHSANLQKKSPTAFNRLRILADTASPEEYKEMLALPPRERLQRLYESTKDRKPRYGSEPLSARMPMAKPQASMESLDTNTPNKELPTAPASAQSSPQDDSTENNDNTSLDLKEQPKDSEAAHDTTPEPSSVSAYANRGAIRQKPQAALTAITTTKNKKPEPEPAQQGTQGAQDAPKPESQIQQEEDDAQLSYQLDQHRTSRKAARAKLRSEQPEEFKKQLKQRTAEVFSQKKPRGAQVHEEDAKRYVLNSIAAVKLTKEGKWVQPPDGFEPHKDSFYELRLNRNAIERSGFASKEEDKESYYAGEAYIMCTLLYRKLGKQRSEEILNIEDDAKRLATIRSEIKGLTLSNTEVPLPSLKLPSNTIRLVDALKYEDYQKNGTKYQDSKTKEKHGIHDYPAIDKYDSLPYLVVRSQAEAHPNFSTQSRDKQGFDILTPMGSGKLSDNKLKGLKPLDFATVNSIHGGHLDRGQPEIKDDQGNIIQARLTREQYAQKVADTMDGTYQSFWHEILHSMSQSSQEYTYDDNEEQAKSLVPGMHHGIHLAKATEMLAAASAFRRFVTDNFDGYQIKDFNDFEDFYEAIWLPLDNSPEANEQRAKIPRNEYLLMSEYEKFDWISKDDKVTHQLFRKYRKEITSAYPNIESVDDLIDGYETIWKHDDKTKMPRSLRYIYTYFDQNNLNGTIIRKNRTDLRKFKEWFNSNNLWNTANNRRTPQSNSDNSDNWV